MLSPSLPLIFRHWHWPSVHRPRIRAMWTIGVVSDGSAPHSWPTGMQMIQGMRRVANYPRIVVVGEPTLVINGIMGEVG